MLISGKTNPLCPLLAGVVLHMFILVQMGKRSCSESAQRCYYLVYFQLSFIILQNIRSVLMIVTLKSTEKTLKAVNRRFP